MNYRHPYTLLLLIALLTLLPTTAALAQYHPTQQHRAHSYVPPPLWVKVPGPVGMQVTFYPGGKMKPRTLTAPFTVALRPGYIHRVRVSNIPGHPTMVLYPTLEVRGSLQNDKKFRAKNHPARLTFSEEDFSAIVSGALITKVIALERQKDALAVTTTPDRPTQINVLPEDDPLKIASQQALPFLIMRFGQRDVSEKELRAGGISGTVYLPGDKSFPIPSMAPFLPWACVSLYDPRLGPQSLGPEICLPDGGDSGPRVGHDFMGRLQGFDPSDTVAEFTDPAGKRRIAVSNRVCICVPRFLVYRGEMILQGRYTYNGTTRVQVAKGTTINDWKQPVVTQQQNTQLDTVHNKQGVVAAQANKGTVIYGQFEGVDVRASVNGTEGVTSRCLTLTGEELPGRPLIVVKWPDRCDAQIGDTITFTLKFTNRSRRPLRNIVVSDNLTTRFEYVDGSARTDRPANFTTQPNDHGSLILRWELVGDLPPGQSGIVTFRVKIR